MKNDDQTALEFVIACLVLAGALVLWMVYSVNPVKAQTVERPSVTACAHEPHAHQDEDLRIRMSVRITGSDPCGFGWETAHEVGRLEFSPETAVATTALIPTGGNTTLITVRDVRKGRTALIVFCSYCKSAIYVGLTEVQK